MYLKEKRGDDNFMCSWGAFLHYYNAGIFTCFPPTYDVYSVVIVITTGAGGRLGGGLVGYPEATGVTSLLQNFGFVLLGI